MTERDTERKTGSDRQRDRKTAGNRERKGEADRQTKILSKAAHFPIYSEREEALCPCFYQDWKEAGNTNRMGRLSTVHLQIN